MVVWWWHVISGGGGIAALQVGDESQRDPSAYSSEEKRGLANGDNQRRIWTEEEGS